MDVITPQTDSVQSTHHLHRSNASDLVFVHICVKKRKTLFSPFNILLALESLLKLYVFVACIEAYLALLLFLLKKIVNDR